MPVLWRPPRCRRAHLPALQRVPALSEDPALVLLRDAPLELVGQISPASNVALLVRLGAQGPYAIYKPVRGERPLWDFPDGTLADREVAAYLLSEAGGWGAISPTVLRDGPWGPGSVQLWVGDPEEDLASVVDVVPAQAVLAGWVPGFHGEDQRGRPVAVVHEDRPDVRSLAVLDVVLNNADRKGAHVARGPHGRLWAFDHGVTLHTEDKLRTVLWGFVGDPVPTADLDRLDRLIRALTGPDASLRDTLEGHLTRAEIDAVAARAARLRQTGRMPAPSPDWPSIPWPPL